MTKIIGDSALLDTWAATGTKTDPLEPKKNSGWADGERPAFDFMNFIQSQFGEKINHILANGVPAWNATTAYAANSFASRSGVIYRAVTGSTNSQPPSVNWVTISPDVTDIVGGIFAGQVSYFAMSSAPSGFLAASGQAVSRVTYSRLFARIGTTFGAGDGSTTFNVPNINGRFIRSWDNGAGIDIGRAFGSLQSDQIKSHTHLDWNFNDSTGVNIQNVGNFDGNGGPRSRSQITGGATGGNETRPTNIALLACIKW